MPAMSRFDVGIARLAAVQHGVVARDQLLDLGSVGCIERRLRDRRLVRRHRATYVVPSVPPSWRQNLLAACFAGGKWSVASFRAATKLWELPGGAEMLEVTTARHRRVRAATITPHESHYLSETDITYIDNIPVTRPARTIVDLGLLVETGALAFAELELALHEAMRRNLVDIAGIAHERERLGGDLRAGGTVIADLLDNFVPPLRRAESTPELRLLMLLRSAGLPDPVPQFRVWISPTRWYDLDFAWPDRKAFAEFSDYKWHGARDKHSKDIARLLELQALGWEGVVVDGPELDAGASRATNALRTILGRRAG
jgi:hypothetical protein